MTKEELITQIHKKKSFLCVGLDSDITKIPHHLLSEKNPLLAFNKAIIDATKDYCVAYKPNIAFYESLGPQGWEILEQTLDYIPKDIFTIADAKRGDIGNTSKMYAKTFFEYYNFDAVTVAPYMGEDSVRPFLEFDGKWVILLGLTSNSGHSDFQTLTCSDGIKVYEKVLNQAKKWGSHDQLMFVIGATHPDLFTSIRQIIPDYFFLVPGVGAQGGNLQEVASKATNNEVGLLVNSSREIIYASSGLDFAKSSATKCASIIADMAPYI